MQNLFFVLFTLALVSSCSGGGSSPQNTQGAANQNPEGDSAIVQPGAPEAAPSQDQGENQPAEAPSKPAEDTSKYIQIRTGTPTIGGDHCPEGSQISEGSNDTKGLVSVATDAKNFTCTINFSKPYPTGPICAITSQGWVTPPDMTYKINAVSKDLIEVTGTTNISPLAGFVFNYICL